MKRLCAEKINALRKSYPVGTKIVLVYMDDLQAPPPGTEGRVTGVDDMGSLLVSWENGSGLHLLLGVDTWVKVGKE